MTSGPSPANEILRGVQAVTDTALANLDVEDLVAALLIRVRDQLQVDTATVLLLDPYGQELVATVSLGLEEEVAQGVRVPIGQGFAGSVASTREPSQLEYIEPSGVLNQILVQRGISSVLGVPLLAARQLLGVLHVGSLRPRRFTAEEVNLLQLAAERVASATQARLSQLDRATTVALQRSLLPARHIDLHGLEIAARYVPGSRDGVGGDWYDAFRLPSGYTGMVIGDVAGHGLRAAVVMGRIRSALRAYALESDDPADVIARLDRKISVFEPGAMATAIYAVITPDLRQVRMSVAGHPPPIISAPGRSTAIVKAHADLPLGVDPDARRDTTEVPFAPGSLLLLYTDGLVERRDETIDCGLARLSSAVRPGVADHVCAQVMSKMIGNRRADDDIAILAVSRPP